MKCLLCQHTNVTGIDKCKECRAYLPRPSTSDADESVFLDTNDNMRARILSPQIPTNCVPSNHQVVPRDKKGLIVTMATCSYTVTFCMEKGHAMIGLRHATSDWLRSRGAITISSNMANGADLNDNSNAFFNVRVKKETDSFASVEILDSPLRISSHKFSPGTDLVVVSKVFNMESVVLLTEDRVFVSIRHKPIHQNKPQDCVNLVTDLWEDFEREEVKVVKLTVDV